MICLIVLGLSLYNGFPKRESPEITIRQANVAVDFVGMSPLRLENLIVDPVERKIREIPEVKDILTKISNGNTLFEVVLRDEVVDLDPVWQELRDKMEEVAPSLPDGTIGPFVNSNVGDVSIASIALTADGFSFREMEETAKNLQRLIYTIDGVANIRLFGVQPERIWLEVDLERLAANGIQTHALINELQAQNVILPAGSLNAAGERILLESSGDFKSIDEIRNMLTRIGNSDDFARLGDVLKVRRGLVSPKQQPVFYNGREAIVISVEMRSGYNIDAVGHSLIQMTTDFENSLPIGYELNFAAFQPKEVHQAVNNAVNNVAQTVVVVMLIMIIFLGIRSGLMIATIVPFAIMFALVGMNLLSLNLERISIAAIIISLGLLVDNGVVIIEDIVSRIQQGMSSSEAALAAGKQYATPLLVSSLTTIFAFIPFFLMDGNEGQYAFSLGAVVTITLAGSWFSAIYFLPFIARWGFKSIKADKQAPADDTTFTHNGYDALLNWSLRFAPLVIFLCYAAVLVALNLFSQLPAQMFPTSNRVQVLIYQEMPKGTDITATETSALEVAKWLNDPAVNPGLDNHVLYIGSGGPRFFLSLEPSDSEPENAFFLVNAHSVAEAEAFSEKAHRYLIENHPEGQFKITRLTMSGMSPGTVDVEISGQNADQLLAYGEQIKNAFRDIEGMRINEDDWGGKRPKVIVDIDQNKARRTHTSSETFAQTLAAYFDGITLSEYREDDQSIPIVLRAAEHNRDSIEDLMSLSVDYQGAPVPLEQVADLRPVLEHATIRRKNQVRTITVTGRSNVLTAAELAEAIQPVIDDLNMPPTYRVAFGGELEQSAESYGDLASSLPVAFGLMIAAIVFLFNSFRRTLIIILSIPLAFIGVPIGLLASAQPVSFFGTLGILSLAGIIINNAIVLIDQIDIDREQLSLDDAIKSAAKKRLRPIMLTSATTILGLAPLYLFGGPLWKPLAVVMMSGLAIASVLTLFFVAASYRLLMK